LTFLFNRLYFPMETKIEEYVTNRLTLPYNWTGLTPAEMIQAGRMDSEGMAGALWAQVKQMNQEEMEAEFPNFNLFPDGEINMETYMDFIRMIGSEFRRQVWSICSSPDGE
jgi:hypothetical protein